MSSPPPPKKLGCLEQFKCIRSDTFSCFPILSEALRGCSFSASPLVCETDWDGFSRHIRGGVLGMYFKGPAVSRLPSSSSSSLVSLSLMMMAKKHVTVVVVVIVMRVMVMVIKCKQMAHFNHTHTHTHTHTQAHTTFRFH